MAVGQSSERIKVLQNLALSVEYDSLERAHAYNELAAVYYNRDLQQARRYHRNALKLLTQVPPAVERGQAHLNEAHFRYGQGQYAAAIEQAQQARRIGQGYEHGALEGGADALLSLVYSTKGYAYEGTVHGLRAAETLRQQPNSPSLALSYYQLGNSFIMLNDTSKALTYFRIAMTPQVREGQGNLVALINVERGLVHLQRSEQRKAKERLELALEQGKNEYNIRGIAYANYALGLLASREQANEEALNYFKIAKDHYDQLEDNVSTAKVLKGMAAVFLNSRQYTKAELYLQDALNRARVSRAMVMVKSIYYDLSNVYRTAGRYADAMNSQQKYHSIKDSIFNHDKNRTIAEIQSRYQMKELERKNAELERERNLNLALQAETLQNQELRNRQNSYAIFGLTSVFALMAIIGFLVFRQQKLNNQIRIKGLEQRALRAQMNPHFLFNSLNSIQSLIATDRNAEASIYLAKFSRLMRRILNNSRQAYIPLSQEIEFLDNYIELEQRRFTEAFEYELREDVEDTDFVMIQPMVIQPFIENAIIHGLLRQPEKKGTLLVHFREYSETLIQCIIEDNGIGRVAAAAYKNEEKQESLGVKITEQRLKQSIKEKIIDPVVRYVDLVDADGQAAGTRVEVLLPIKFKA